MHRLALAWDGERCKQMDPWTLTAHRACDSVDILTPLPATSCLQASLLAAFVARLSIYCLCRISSEHHSFDSGSLDGSLGRPLYGHPRSVCRKKRSHMTHMPTNGPPLMAYSDRMINRCAPNSVTRRSSSKLGTATPVLERSQPRRDRIEFAS